MDFSQNQLGYFPQLPVLDDGATVEMNSDFTLPDYNSEIRRLLSCRAIPLSQSEYVGNSTAEISGEICYRVLYLGADGKLYSADLSDSYSLSMPLNFDARCVDTGNLSLYVTIEQDGVNARVLGPRRLNIKARLTCRALALGPHLLAPTVNGASDGSSIEDLILVSPCLNMKKCESEPLLLSDLIPLEHGEDDIRLIDRHACSHIDECSASDQRVNVKGEVLLKLLYCNDFVSDEVLSTVRRLPFSVNIPCEGVNSSFECSALCHLASETVEIDENGIRIELPLTVSAIAQSNIDVPYIADAFSTENECETAVTKASIRVAVRNANGSLTQNEVFPLDEVKLRSDCKIVDVRGSAKTNSVTQENGRLIIKGVSNYSLIHLTDGEYGECSTSAPFRYELDCRACEGDGDLLCNVVTGICSARARADGERLFIDGELSFCITAQRDEDITYLSELTFTEPREKRDGAILLCYPESGATLWSIAKRYGRTQRSIIEQNDLLETDRAIKKKFLVI